MASISFTHVPIEGFAAFGSELDHDIWGTIDISTYVGADGRLLQSLSDAPALVLFKAQLLSAIAKNVMVVESTSGAKACNDVWDNMQKRLSGLITVARFSTNPQEKAAGDRLHDLMLLGKSGEAQTRLSYHQEVDFGRKQIRLAAESSCAADIALLKLGSVMTSIAMATDALAAALGQGRSALAPAKQRRAALNECSQVFGGVYRALDWIAENGSLGDERAKAIGLRASMEHLAARYTVREPKPQTALRAAPAVS